MTDLPSLFASLEAASRDPAFAHLYASQLRQHAPSIVAALFDAQANQTIVPPYASLTRLQVSVFDNWRPFDFKKPSYKQSRQKGGRMARHKVTIDGWTTKPTKLSKANRAFGVAGTIVGTPAALQELIKGVPPLRDAAGDWLAYRDKLVEIVNAGMMVSPLYRAKGEGSTYMLDKFVALDPAYLVNPAEDLKLAVVSDERWSIDGFQPSSEGNVILSARLSIDSGGPWPTGILDPSRLA